MTRREEIQQAIFENGIDYCENHPEMNMSLKEAFVMGAVWADRTMIDKACEWLYVYYPTLERSKSAEDAWDKFKKAMEE